MNTTTANRVNRKDERRQKTSQRKTPVECRLGFEALEERHLLSVNWINRGAASGDENERFDIVFDASGLSTFPECRRLLAPGGFYVNTLPNGALFGWSWWLRLTARERVVPLMERPNLADLQHLVDEAAAGRLKSVAPVCIKLCF